MWGLPTATALTALVVEVLLAPTSDAHEREKLGHQLRSTRGTGVALDGGSWEAELGGGPARQPPAGAMPQCSLIERMRPDPSGPVAWGQAITCRGGREGTRTPGLSRVKRTL